MMKKYPEKVTKILIDFPVADYLFLLPYTADCLLQITQFISIV